MISATADSTDWLFPEDHWGTSFAELDVYDRCIHLVPDSVFMMCRQVVTDRIFNLWSKGRRLIYFINSVKGMATLIEELNARGISNDDIGIAFSNSKNANLLPQKLLSRKNSLRDRIVQESIIPPKIKIFITTSQNKEGISIVDDDIKYMFSEAHNKADLEQMAGRVRRNPENGTGLHGLIVVYDADEHPSRLSYTEKKFDRVLLDHADSILKNHETLIEKANKDYCIKEDIASIHKNHFFLRYDFIGKRFEFYRGREECSIQEYDDHATLHSLMELWDEHLEYELVAGGMISVTGGYELKRTWFPYSKLYQSPGLSTTPQEAAYGELLSYLQENNFLNARLDKDSQDVVKEKICLLIRKYGKKELGFDKEPSTLGPAVKRFGLSLIEVPDHKSTDKILCHTSAPEEFVLDVE